MRRLAWLCLDREKEAGVPYFHSRIKIYWEQPGLQELVRTHFKDTEKPPVSKQNQNKTQIYWGEADMER